MKKESDNIIVSICCLAYNHEEYIEQAIEGFLMQDTNFQIEILIHDDASTDRTRKIIEKYHAEYPNLIKPIYQEENQYSKGIKPIFKYLFPRAKGKYIALCEGDDYWTDSLKLQNQVNFLEENKGVVFCFTNGLLLDNDNNSKVHLDNTYVNGIINKYSLIEKGSSSFITASLLFRNKLLIKFIEDFNLLNFQIGDLPLMLHACQIGEIGFLNEITSVYRLNTPESWTIKHSEFKPMSINIIHSIKIIEYYVNSSVDLKFKKASKILIQNYYVFLIFKYKEGESNIIKQIIFLFKYSFKIKPKSFLINLLSILKLK